MRRRGRLPAIPVVAQHLLPQEPGNLSTNLKNQTEWKLGVLGKLQKAPSTSKGALPAQLRLGDRHRVNNVNSALFLGNASSSDVPVVMIKSYLTVPQ